MILHHCILLLSFYTVTAWASGDHGAPLSVGKGIVSFDEHEGFELSSEAKARFKITTQKLVGKGPWAVPKSALVFSLDEVRVYSQKNGKLQSHDVEVVSKAKDTSTIKSEHLQEGDEVVITGAGYIRVAEMDASGGEEEGHGH